MNQTTKILILFKQCLYPYLSRNDLLNLKLCNKCLARRIMIDTQIEKQIITFEDIINIPLLFEMTIASYLTINDIYNLKLCDTQLNQIISTSTHLERQCYSRLCYHVLSNLTATYNQRALRSNEYFINNTNNPLNHTSITDIIRHMEYRYFKTSKQYKYLTRRKTYHHCNNSCAFNIKTHWFIEAYKTIFYNDYLLIEKTFIHTPIAILSRITRYYHDVHNVIVYRSPSAINPYHLRYMEQRKKHFLLNTSFCLIQIKHHKTCTQLEHNHSYNESYTFDKTGYTKFLDDYRLQTIFTIIPLKFRSNYFITGYPLICYVLQEIEYQQSYHPQTIFVYAFHIKYSNHDNNITLITKHLKEHDLYLKNIQKDTLFITRLLFTNNNNLFEICFIFNDNIGIPNIIGSFGTSIEQFGITFDRFLYYTEAWLFTFKTKIGHYFKLGFNSFFNNHKTMKHYCISGQHTWLLSRSLLNMYHNNPLALLHNTHRASHRLFNFRKSMHIQNKSITAKLRTQWDNDKIMLRFIQKILYVFTQQHQTINNHTTNNKILKDGEAIYNDISDHFAYKTVNCVCFG